MKRNIRATVREEECALVLKEKKNPSGNKETEKAELFLESSGGNKDAVL